MKCVPLAEDPREIARRHLAEAANGWSVGTWGAIGEFQYDADEPGLVVDPASLSVTSARGALHVGDRIGAGAAGGPSADSAGRSPEGPHSHLLPQYVEEGRARPPGSPLPAGLCCGLSLYPRTRL